MEMSVLAAVPVPACASILALQPQAAAQAAKTAHLLVMANAHPRVAIAAPVVLAVLRGVGGPALEAVATVAPGVTPVAPHLAVETVQANAADVSHRAPDRARVIVIRIATHTAGKAAQARANQAVPPGVPVVAMGVLINVQALVMARAPVIATAVPGATLDALRNVRLVALKIVVQPVLVVAAQNAAVVTAALAAVQAPAPADV